MSRRTTNRAYIERMGARVPTSVQRDAEEASVQLRGDKLLARTGIDASALVDGTLPGNVIINGILYIPDITGVRTELGPSGVYIIRYWDGTTTWFSLDTSGNVVLSGSISASSIDIPSSGTIGFHVDSSGNLGIGGPNATGGVFTVTSVGAVTASSVVWGNASSLIAGDALEMNAASGFNTPVRVQAPAGVAQGNVSSITATAWSPATTAGNLLVIAVQVSATPLGAGSAYSFTTPAGWTAGPVKNNIGGYGVPTTAIAYFFKTAAGTDATPAVALAAGTGDMTIQTFEYSGVVVATDKTATDSGTSSIAAPTMDTGTTATTTQAAELWLGAMGQAATGSTTTTPGNGFTRVTNTAGVGTTGSFLVSTEKMVTSRGAASTNYPAIIVGQPWAGVIMTFKATTKTLDNPASGLMRLFGVQRAGSTSLTDLAEKDTTGRQLPLVGTVALKADNSRVDLTADYTNNTVTETAALTLTVPANSVVAGSVFRCRAIGTVTTTATSHVLTLGLRWGGTAGVVICNPTITTIAVAGTRGFTVDFTFTVRTLGASGTALGNAWGNERVTAATDTGIMQSPGQVTIDTTANKDLVLTSKWDSIATNANTVTMQQGFIEVVSP